MQPIPVPFGEWLPDLGENNNPGLVEAKNVIARSGGYAPLLDVGETETGPTLGTGADITGAGIFGGFDSSGSLYKDGFALPVYGTEDRLFKQKLGGTATTVSFKSTAGGLGYGRWYFAAYGDYIFATRRPNPSAGLSVETYYTPNTVGTGWTAITGGPNVAAYVARFGNFIMLAHIEHDSYSFANSAINNPLSWTPSQTTMAFRGSMDNVEAGAITGLAGGGRFNLVFQQKSVSAFDFVGTPKIWNQRVISANVGCEFPGSIVTVNDITYFLNTEGVWATNGAGVTPIGAGRVDKWLKEAREAGAASPDGSEFGTLHATVDRVNKCIIWNWSTTGNFTFTRQLIYSYDTNRFSRGEIPNRWLFPSNDYEPWGSHEVLAIDNGSGTPEIGRLDGGSLAAEVTTGYQSLNPGRRIAASDVEPIYDGSGAKVAVNTKQTQAGAATAGTPVAVNSLGIGDARADGRLAAVSVTFDAAASWGELKGAVVRGVDSGER